MGGKRLIRLRIQRQDHPDGQPSATRRWEEFALPYRPDMNVISCLMEIQRNPVNARGEKTTPVVWEASCLEEVCGTCSMRINSRVRQACTALIDQLKQPVVLEPMRTFPVVRDLVVDRSRMFEALKRIKGWIPIDGTYDQGPGPKAAPSLQEMTYVLSTCMTCGCCLEACPNVFPGSPFIGAAAINQVRLFNAHPTGAMHKEERLEALLGEGGIAWCGNSQNCVRVCPKKIPLTDSIAAMNAAVSAHALSRLRKG